MLNNRTGLLTRLPNNFFGENRIMAISTLIKKLLMITTGAGLIGLGSVSSAEAATIVRGSIKADGETTTIDYWNFTVNKASKVTMNVLALGIDFGNGPSALDSTITLFRNDGALDRSDFVNTSDENWWDSEALADGSLSYLDSYIAHFLNPGQYILVISDYNLSIREIMEGIQTDNNPLFPNGDYQITFTGDIKLASVPEPTSTLGLLAFGALGAGSILKRKQQDKV